MLKNKALEIAFPKGLVAKKGQLKRCLIDLPLTGELVYDRKLKEGDIVRSNKDCYSSTVFEAVDEHTLPKDTIIYETRSNQKEL